METLLSEANRIGAEIGDIPVPITRFDSMTETFGPTQEDILNAQNMSEEDRGAFIQSMVERLAARLEDEPNDLEGWMQLGNAYSVLGRVDEAIDALEKAELLLSGVPDNDPRSQTISQALSALRP
jgi:cytochrome c-type biogenesis protein CcmH